MNVSPQAIVKALGCARGPILWMGIAYLLGVFAGAGMVHMDNRFALRFRDNLVGQAQSGNILKALDQGHRVRAAVEDFGSNLMLGAVPSTVMGIGIVMPFPLAVFRGWVGGVVSVDGNHGSRLRDGREGLYYVGVMLLQLIPYTLAGGTGVRLGLAFVLPKSRWGYAAPQRWLGLPAEGVRDVVRIYMVVVPLFLVASLVEFLAR